MKQRYRPLLTLGLRTAMPDHLSALHVVMVLFCIISPVPAFAVDGGPAWQSVGQATETTDDANDPLEPVNRAIFGFNEFLQAIILQPLAELYTLMLPDVARDVVRNVMNNLRTPVVLANDVLQGEAGNAWRTTQRFVINSTIGIGGVFDVAKEMGIERHDEDFGQTLAVWGVPEGFYLVLPILGPSSPRDAVGFLGDVFLDPATYWADNTDNEGALFGRRGMRGVDTYSRVMDDLQKLKETSIDYYAVVRSVYRQQRKIDIRNGTPREAPLPDIRYDFNALLTTE